MNKNKVSVIIILYFSKHLIQNIVLNVQQKVKELGEIILVNNSREKIDEFRSSTVSIIYPNKNLGYGGGINLGVKNSRYEFLLILNPDLYIERFDVSLKDWKKEIIISGYNPTIPGYYLKFPSLLSTFITNALTTVIYIKFIEKRIHFRKIKYNLQEVKVDYVSGALIFTNKTTFKRIGGFDETFFLFYEETDFCKRASKLNIPVVSTSNIEFKPKIEKSSARDVSSIKIKSEIESSKRYHFKYNGPIATRITFLMLKLYFILMILCIAPISFASKKIKLKKNEFIYRIKFL